MRARTCTCLYESVSSRHGLLAHLLYLWTSLTSCHRCNWSCELLCEVTTVWGNVEANERVEEWKVAGQFVGTNLERPGRGKECRRCRWPWTCLSKRSQLCKIASRMTRHDVILLCDDSRNLFGNPLTLTNDDTLLCCPFRRIALASELGCCLPKS